MTKPPQDTLAALALPVFVKRYLADTWKEDSASVIFRDTQTRFRVIVECHGGLSLDASVGGCSELGATLDRDDQLAQLGIAAFVMDGEALAEGLVSSVASHLSISDLEFLAERVQRELDTANGLQAIARGAAVDATPATTDARPAVSGERLLLNNLAYRLRKARQHSGRTRGHPEAHERACFAELEAYSSFQAAKQIILDSRTSQEAADPAPALPQVRHKP